MYVYVTGLGLRKFRITEIKKFQNSFPVQYKGQYKLPKGHFLVNGKKWVDLDFWFIEDQIFNSDGEKIIIE